MPAAIAPTATGRAIRRLVALVLLSWLLLTATPLASGDVVSAGVAPAHPLIGVWRVVQADLEAARQRIERQLRRIRPLLDSGGRNGRRRDEALERAQAGLLQGLALPRADLSIRHDGEAWIIVTDGRLRRRVTPSAVITQSSPIVRSGALEGSTLFVETANDAGTRIIERYRHLDDGGLQLDLELDNPLFEDSLQVLLLFQASMRSAPDAPHP